MGAGAGPWDGRAARRAGGACPTRCAPGWPCRSWSGFSGALPKLLPTRVPHIPTPNRTQPLTFYATPLRKAEGGLAGAITDLAGYMREAAAGAGGGKGA